jgi:hypothetical protein
MIALKIQVAIIMFCLEYSVPIKELTNQHNLVIFGLIKKNHFALSATNIAQNVPTTLLILAPLVLMGTIWMDLHARNVIVHVLLVMM